MDTWSPLFSSIVRSSIWGEDKHVRIVWVTLLALKDRGGFVETSLPGLARAAVVSMEECEDAIRVLEAPDPHSRSEEFEGRRIKRAEGGWEILGHERYQKRMREVTDRVANARRQRAFRERHRDGKPLPGEVLAAKAATQQEAERIAEACLPEADPECPV